MQSCSNLIIPNFVCYPTQIRVNICVDTNTVTRWSTKAKYRSLWVSFYQMQFIKVFISLPHDAVNLPFISIFIDKWTARVALFYSINNILILFYRITKFKWRFFFKFILFTWQVSLTVPLDAALLPAHICWPVLPIPTLEQNGDSLIGKLTWFKTLEAEPYLHTLCIRILLFL